MAVGEFERAFTDRQFHEVSALLAVHGVAVWLPEVGGPVDLADPNHRVLMQMLAAQSQREAVRSRHRTLAAMTAQTVEQGRFLGGRPPYGYRLVGAGSHPNRAHAAWGRRRQRLDPDPVTARHVRWIFAERLAGRSVDDDWSIAWTGCGCDLCGTLATFLGSRSQQIFEWPLATDGRRHVHNQMEWAGLPVRHQTRRHGRSYTLVLTKTDELFTRARNARHEAVTDRAWLTSTSGNASART